jgi:Domain of unknown function (DUF4455)
VYNNRALANARAIEQVIAKLEIAQVSLQRHVRQEYKLAVADWRLLRTKYVISKFVEDVKTGDSAKAVECTALIDGLRKRQQQSAAEMSTCVLQDVLALQSLQTPQSCRECDTYTVSVCLSQCP